MKLGDIVTVMQLEIIVEDLNEGKRLIEKWDRTGLLKGEGFEKMDMALRLEKLMCYLLGEDRSGYHHDKFDKSGNGTACRYLFPLQRKLDSKYLGIHGNIIVTGDKPRRPFMPLENMQEFIPIHEFNKKVNEEWTMDGGVEWVSIWAREINEKHE